jgi:hypothetical protein
MINKNAGLQLIILGSLIVITGIIMYLTSILGAVGLIILGAIVEVIGLIGYFKK